MAHEVHDLDLLLPEGLRTLLELERAHARAPEGFLHLIELKDAAFVADRSEAHLRRLAQANPYGIVPDGYGYREDGERPWKIVVLPFLHTQPLNMIGRLRATYSWRRIMKSAE
ncbi:hypothetical protein [Bradyrhizobium sp. th.b2]|uniref:hypothetical protein n=1 Tax=Bradyrhizobium sp. th-b2 TaxID=172088 RepID=UPI00048C159D|nr:hypothetical protein [Bradyrhizobium sp. th.b2]